MSVDPGNARTGLTTDRPAACVQPLGLGLPTRWRGPFLTQGTRQGCPCWSIKRQGPSSAGGFLRGKVSRKWGQKAHALPRVQISASVLEAHSLDLVWSRLLEMLGSGAKRSFPTLWLPATTTGSPAGQSELGVRATVSGGCNYPSRHQESPRYAPLGSNVEEARDFGNP